MPLTSTREHAEAVVMGAEPMGTGVILQVSENAVAFHGGNMRPLLSACVSIAASSAVPVAVHLDHFRDARLIEEAIGVAGRLGVSSIMIDASHLPHEQNVQQTRRATRRAQDAGFWVEAELGEIGGKDGAHAPHVRTRPDEAIEFLVATCVDGLAVAVGSSHAMTSAVAELDLGLTARLFDAVGVPLVLHGSSGVRDALLIAAVTAGIRKINVGTALNLAFTTEVRQALATNPRMHDPRTYMARGRDAISSTVSHLCGLMSDAPASAIR
jgi:fructose-bisphosphate aldolase class II